MQSEQLTVCIAWLCKLLILLPMFFACAVYISKRNAVEKALLLLYLRLQIRCSFVCALSISEWNAVGQLTVCKALYNANV